MAMASVSVAIPTYRRGGALLDTLEQLRLLGAQAVEVLVIDQTEKHEASVADALSAMSAAGQIRWLRLSSPSIPRAMNEALRRSQGDVVLFMDDDVEIGSSIVEAHGMAYADPRVAVVVGQIIQPWERVLPPGVGGDNRMPFRFNSSERRWIRTVMAGNMSVRRKTAMTLGGFDENFVHVAYRFEAEFADRVLEAGYSILFEPGASLRHLKLPDGGTRSFGHHLTTVGPSHAVGEYYYLLRRWWKPGRLWQLAARPLRAVSTRHHLRRPWWIPITLTAELLGFCWGLGLALRGPRYLNRHFRCER